MIALLLYPLKKRSDFIENDFGFSFAKFIDKPFFCIGVSLCRIAVCASWNNIRRYIARAIMRCNSNEMIGGYPQPWNKSLLRTAICAAIAPIFKAFQPILISEVVRELSESCAALVFIYSGVLTALHKTLFVIFSLPFFSLGRKSSPISGTTVATISAQPAFSATRWIKVFGSGWIICLALSAILHSFWRFMTRCRPSNNYIASFAFALAPASHLWSLKEVIKWIFSAAYPATLRRYIRGIINLSHGVYLALTQSPVVGSTRGLRVPLLYHDLPRVGAQ